MRPRRTSSLSGRPGSLHSMAGDNNANTDTGYALQKPEGLLAHYTTAVIAFEHVLSEGGRLRLSRYRDMNDPAEAQDLRIGFGYGDRSDDEVNATYGAALQVVQEYTGFAALVLPDPRRSGNERHVRLLLGASAYVGPIRRPTPRRVPRLRPRQAAQGLPRADAA